MTSRTLLGYVVSDPAGRTIPGLFSEWHDAEHRADTLTQEHRRTNPDGGSYDVAWHFSDGTTTHDPLDAGRLARAAD